MIADRASAEILFGIERQLDHPLQQRLRAGTRKIVQYQFLGKEPADVANDQVDGDDLAIWQDGLGSTGLQIDSITVGDSQRDRDVQAARKVSAPLWISMAAQRSLK